MSILRLPHTVMTSMRRFPEVMVVCWTYMVLSILQIHGYYMGHSQTAPVYLTTFLLNGKETWGQVVEAVSLGIPLALEIQLLIERFWPGKVGIRLVLDIAGIGILILYYYFFSSGYEGLVRYTTLLFALAGLCAVTPYFRRNDKLEWFLWQFLSRGIVAVVYWVVLIWGVGSAAELVSKLLFQLSLPIFSDLLIVVASLFLPIFFCAGISEYPVKLDVSHAPQWWYTVLSYLAVPLLTVYTVVVYVLFAAMLVCRQWPEGIVTSLVIFYALLLTAILILAYPYRQEKPWLGRFVFFAPRLLLPLLGMMLIDMGMRIQAYGVTENRYFVVLASVFMIGCMVYYIAAKTVNNTIIVSSTALLAFLAVIGPWSCFSVSDYSQAQRFQALLIKNHVLQDGKIHKADPSLAAEDRRTMESMMRYFQKKDRLDTLSYLPPHSTVEQLYAALGLADIYDYQHFYHHHDHDLDVCKMNAIDVRGMDYFVTATGKNENSMLDPALELVLSYDAASHELKLTKAKQLLYSKNISEFVAKIHQAAHESTVLDRRQMMFTDENERVVVHYAFARVIGETDRSGKVVVIYEQPFQLAIKLK